MSSYLEVIKTTTSSQFLLDRATIAASSNESISKSKISCKLKSLDAAVGELIGEGRMTSSILLEIQSRELKFIFEPKKQSNSSVLLVNKTDQHVAFKVKTTTPKKYCVRPNVGVILPKETCEFVVTMQAQRSVPPDMICKDKFLVQSTIVPAGTTEDDVTSEMFSKEDGKYVEEKKVRVILVSPPHSPELSPINRDSFKSSAASFKSSAVAEELVEKPSSYDMNEQQVKESKTVSAEEPKLIRDTGHEPVSQEEFKPMKATESEPDREVESEPIQVKKSVEREKKTRIKTTEGLESVTGNTTENFKLVKDVEEMKFKLLHIESKLNKAEITVTKLRDERKLTIQEQEQIKGELAFLRTTRKAEKTVEEGYPLFFVCLVALVSVVLGYFLHP